MLGPIIALATALVAGLAWNAAAKWAWTSASAGRFSPSSDRVLLVVAHPDDESMFFAPLLLSLRRAEVPVFVLCLSTGGGHMGHGMAVRHDLRLYSAGAAQSQKFSSLKLGKLGTDN